MGNAWMNSVRRAAVYIDGYNLYYGRLRGTAYKWLDVVTFFDNLLRIQDPKISVQYVQYFSAPALKKFSAHGEQSILAQQDYHRALSKIHGNRFRLTLGAHSYNREGALLPAFIDGVPYDKKNRVRVWKLEEKKTDVNIALSMYRDARRGELDSLIVCSADSDVEPVLRAIREDRPHLQLGVVMPRRASDNAAGKGGRGLASSLDEHADWTRRHLLDQELEASLLPNIVQTGRKPIRKPEHW